MYIFVKESQEMSKTLNPEEIKQRIEAIVPYTTVAEVEQLLNMPKTTLYQFLAGKRPIPKKWHQVLLTYLDGGDWQLQIPIKRREVPKSEKARERMEENKKPDLPKKEEKLPPPNSPETPVTEPDLDSLQKELAAKIIEHNQTPANNYVSVLNRKKISKEIERIKYQIHFIKNPLK